MCHLQWGTHSHLAGGKIRQRPHLLMDVYAIWAKDCDLSLIIGKASFPVCGQRRLLDTEIDLFRNLLKCNLRWCYEPPKVLEEGDPVAHCHDRQMLPTGGHVHHGNENLFNQLSSDQCQGHSTHDAPSEQKTRKSS